MTLWTKRGVDIFAPTDAAGNLRKVINGEVQVWSREVESAIDAAIASGALVYATKAELDADLNHDAGTGAWVVGDTDALNGIYSKSGASGVGSWSRVSDLPSGPQGDIGGIAFSFDDGTADANPGAGNIRANNTDLSAATMLFASKASRYGDDLSAFLSSLDDSTSSHKGYLTLTAPDSETQTVFSITTLSDASGYVKLSVSQHSGATSFVDAERLVFQFSRTGNAGDLNGVSPGNTGLELLEAIEKDEPFDVVAYLNDAAYNVPSDFPDIQSALDYLKKRPVAAGVRVTVNIETGHQLTKGFRIDNCDMTHVKLTSDDAVVSISNTFVPVSNSDLDPGVPRTSLIAFLAVNAKMPEWDIVVDCANFPLLRGYTLNNNSYGYVRPGKGVKNVDNGANDGACLNTHASRIDGYQSEWSGGGSVAASITVSSIANLSRAVCIDSTDTGLDVSRGSFCYFYQGIATGCREGLYCRRSVVVADGASFSNNTSVDVWAALSSFVGVGGSTLDGSMPSLGRIICSGGSFVAADGATANGNPIDHVDVAGTGSSVKTINYPCGPGMVTNSAVANRASRAVTKSDVLKFERADRVSVPALSYSTIYEVVSGGASIVGGSIWGYAVGCRITVDGVEVGNFIGLTGGRDSGTDIFSVFTIPAIEAKDSVKIEAYNRATGGAADLGWQLTRR